MASYPCMGLAIPLVLLLALTFVHGFRSTQKNEGECGHCCPWCILSSHSHGSSPVFPPLSHLPCPPAGLGVAWPASHTHTHTITIHSPDISTQGVLNDTNTARLATVLNLRLRSRPALLHSRQLLHCGGREKGAPCALLMDTTPSQCGLSL